jgi:hypothetical protein
MTGMSFCSPDHSNSTARNNDAFVDDTTGGVNDTHLSTPLSPTELAARLQKQAQLWERLLFASGGRLELPKCFFYMIVWKWTDGDATMMSVEELNASISLTCGSNPHPVPIAQKEVHTSHKTLGTQMNPTGTMTAETNRLKAKASTIAAAIERFEGPPWKAHLLYTSRYQPSLAYSLPITTLSAAQVKSIQTRPIKAILGSLGVNRMFPRDVAHGPLTHGGLGLPHLLTIQGVSQIALLTGHIRQNDVNGKLTLACLDSAQLIAGVSAPLLEYPSLTHPHLKDPWLDSHRSFLTECDAKLIISAAWTPTLHRTKDRLIMEVAEKSKTTPIDLRHVNQCRLYLKVQRLSDLCNGAGTEFLPKALSHTYPSHNVESNLTWPRQGEPSPRAWATWKKILRRLFLIDRDGPLRSLALSIPLGPWTIDMSSADISWPYYYDLATDTAYERILDDYWPMLRVRRCRRNKYEFSNDVPDNMPLLLLPLTATPATLTTRTPNSVILSISSTGNRQTVSQSTSTAHSTESTSARSRTIPSKIPVTHLPEWEQPFLRHNHRLPTGPSWPPTSFPDITVGLTSKQDGDSTLYAWYIPFAGEPLLSGSGKLPESPTSFPPRALGNPVALYSALRCLQLLITPALWSTIKTVTAVQIQDIHPFFHFIQLDRHHPSRCCTPFFVWKTLLRGLLLNIKFTIQLPADTTNATTVSPSLRAVQESQQTLATYMKSDISKADLFALTIPAERVTLRIANAAVVSGTFTVAFTTAHRLPSLQLHQCTRNKWTASTYSSIHWSAFYRSFKKRKLTSQLRLQKFSNGWLPVGRIRHRINPDFPDSCPSCWGRNETSDHIMRCRDHRRAELHYSQLDDLDDHLSKTNTPQSLATAIIKGITGWYRNPNYQIPIPRYDRISSNTVLRKALTDQNTIGWGRMYSGQISQDFQTVHNVDRPQGSHNRHANAATLSDWASKLITLFFDQVEDQWKLRNEALHGRDRAENSLFHRAILQAKATRLYAYSGNLRALDRPILSQPLTTILDLPNISLEAWISQTEVTLLRCISDANDDHVQTNNIDNYFLRRRRDG